MVAFLIVFLYPDAMVVLPDTLDDAIFGNRKRHLFAVAVDAHIGCMRLTKLRNQFTAGFDAVKVGSKLVEAVVIRLCFFIGQVHEAADFATVRAGFGVVFLVIDDFGLVKDCHAVIASYFHANYSFFCYRLLVKSTLLP